MRACLNLAIPTSCDPISLQSEQPEIDGEKEEEEEEGGDGDGDGGIGDGNAGAEGMEADGSNDRGSSGAADDGRWKEGPSVSQPEPLPALCFGSAVAPQLNLEFEIDTEIAVEIAALTTAHSGEASEVGEGQGGTDQGEALSSSPRPVYVARNVPAMAENGAAAGTSSVAVTEGGTEAKPPRGRSRDLFCFFAEFGTSRGWWVGRCAF